MKKTKSKQRKVGSRLERALKGQIRRLLLAGRPMSNVLHNTAQRRSIRAVSGVGEDMMLRLVRDWDAASATAHKLIK